MVCPNCNGKVKKEDIFCSNCGCLTQQVQYVNAYGQGGYPVVVSKKSNKKYFIGGCVATAVIALVVVLIVSLSKDDSNDYSPYGKGNENYTAQANASTNASTNAKSEGQQRYEALMGTYQITNEWKESKDGGYWGVYDLSGKALNELGQFMFFYDTDVIWMSDDFYDSMQYHSPCIYVNNDGINMTAIGDNYYSISNFTYYVEDGYEIFADEANGIAFCYGNGQYFSMYNHGNGWVKDYLYERIY